MEQEQDIIGLIEYEVAILVRRAVAAGNVGSLDRSAYLLLRQLEMQGPVGVKALADEFRLDISTVSRQTAALEAKGLVQRLPNPEDGRASLFQITDEGMRQLTETRTARKNRYSLLLKDWSDEDRRKLGGLLARLNRTFID
ncbi:MarR family transcriptional regulator [Brevibacillus sp. SYP-B805]|uniref:MarR family winged helix-turn-helix transcriptional regulator n=1 Tax=Brevibacillus sp. SYP-B805 TaxID=1578199 RepID=UPI001F493662|nr:MarR family transcriptional regulator [Brevibacillus sp. SYP-B805]